MSRTKRQTFNRSFAALLSQRLRISILLCISLVISGCSVSQIPDIQQQWSPNYARMEGVSATHAAMTDGDQETAGEAESARTTARVLIVLSQPQFISKVVLVSKDLKQDPFSGKRCELHLLTTEGWQLVKTFTVSESLTAIRFAATKTDQIRLIPPTKLRYKEAKENWQAGYRTLIKYYDSIPPKIDEVEVYGPRV